jgi:hypothetical protein
MEISGQNRVQKGLIVWQEEAQHIIGLFATYALQILDDLRGDDTLTEIGIAIGEPVTRVPLEGPERTPQPALDNPIHLSPRQTNTLLRLRVRNEKRLASMSEEERNGCVLWGGPICES